MEYAGLQTVIRVQDDKLIHGTVQDCDPILEDAKARNRAGMHGTSEMKHAARFPLVAVEKYCNEKGITLEEWNNNPHHIRTMLNDSALSYFRIWEGAV